MIAWPRLPCTVQLSMTRCTIRHRPHLLEQQLALTRRVRPLQPRLPPPERSCSKHRRASGLARLPVGLMRAAVSSCTAAARGILRAAAEPVL